MVINIEDFDKEWRKDLNEYFKDEEIELVSYPRRDEECYNDPVHNKSFAIIPCDEVMSYIEDFQNSRIEEWEWEIQEEFRGYINYAEWKNDHPMGVIDILEDKHPHCNVTLEHDGEKIKIYKLDC